MDDRSPALDYPFRYANLAIAMPNQDLPKRTSTLIRTVAGALGGALVAGIAWIVVFEIGVRADWDFEKGMLLISVFLIPLIGVALGIVVSHCFRRFRAR